MNHSKWKGTDKNVAMNVSSNTRGKTSSKQNSSFSREVLPHRTMNPKEVFDQVNDPEYIVIWSAIEKIKSKRRS